jgi:hypothetical protein
MSEPPRGTDEQRTARAFASALSAPQPSPPPPAALLVKEVLRRARQQGELEHPLPITAGERAAFDRFGIEVRDEDGPRFWCGTAPGWQRFEVQPDPPVAA